MICVCWMTKEGFEICRAKEMEKVGSSEGLKQNISRLSDDVAESWKRFIHGAIGPYFLSILEISLMDPGAKLVVLHRLINQRKFSHSRLALLLSDIFDAQVLPFAFRGQGVLPD
jgi:hypothetical protein